MNKSNPSFLVNVTVQDNIWTAECGALGLVTEAGSYEELVERAWEIAPDLAELNGVASAGDICLRFEHEPVSHRIAM